MPQQPDDRPTERLRPSPPPPPPPPVYEERAVAPAVDPNVVLLRLEDAVASLRTGLVVVGVIAVAALAVGLYALLSADEDSGGGSRAGLASDARVSQLDDRVDRLSRQVQSLRSGGAGDDTEALEERIDELEDAVRTVSSRPSGDPQPAIDELSQRIDAIAQDVEALKQQTGGTAP